jgi:hypothetical protein
MKRQFAIRRTLTLGRGVIFLLFTVLGATPSHADTITVGGTINQSVSDGTGPAGNNAGLNQISDGDSYTVNLSFTGAISTSGTYPLTGVSFITSSGAKEDSFSSAILTVLQSGNSEVLSLFACLATGSGCDQGNELGLNFSVASADFTSLNGTPQQIDGLLPLDLLEDDGVTDLHGSVSSFSNTSPASSSTGVPEPSVLELLAFSLVGAAFVIGEQKFKGKASRSPSLA